MHVFFEMDSSELDAIDGYKAFNGLALDKANRRLYFSARTKPGSKVITELFFYDLDAKQLKNAGEIMHDNGFYPEVFCGTFGDGKYWYVANDYNKLRTITFDTEGDIAAIAVHDHDMIPATLYPPDNAVELRFGDLAIDMHDGVIYGSTLKENPSKPVFFKYTLGLSPEPCEILEFDGEYQGYVGPTHLQIGRAHV